MKRLLILLLCFSSFLGYAQQHKEHIVLLNKDSIAGYNELDADWRFHGGDDSAWAQKDIIDSDWLVVNPALWLTSQRKDGLDTFNSTCWLRLHLLIDTTIAGRPLAMEMYNLGASEIYIDGKKIKSFGKVRGKDSTEYYNPQNTPFVIIFPTAGMHVLAVRYANYNAQRNYKRYNRNMAGFFIGIGETTSLISWREYQLIINTFTFILLFGIFITLSFLHLFLYLYHRKERSNLYFSIFCFALSIIFYIFFIYQTSHSVTSIFYSGHVDLIIVSIACSSLSGLINELFGNRKSIRARLIKILCIVALGLMVLSKTAGLIAYLVLIIVVLLEAVSLTIIAIYKKIKGARIIGFGILFFTLFLLTIIVLAALGHGNFDDRTIAGRIFELILAAAVLSIPVSMSVYLAWSFSGINKNLTLQLRQVQLLSEKTLEQEQEKKRILESQNEQLEKEVAVRTNQIAKQHEELKAEKKKSDDLLNNILPEEVADELKQKGVSSAKFFDHVTVLFTDFVNFTKAGERMGPQELVDELNTCFKAFDEIISKNNIEKIKTIGDAYLAVSGLPIADENHATAVAKTALEIQAYMLNRKQQLGDKTFEVRIGIHSGSVVAGIVGVKKFAYDIWGDTVNTAARMEQNSEPGKINISQTTFELIKDQFDCTYRGEITAKNKGELSMYFIERMKAL